MLVMSIFMINSAFPQESTKPPKPITTLRLSARVLQKLFKNSHYKVIGSCAWLVKRWPPKIVPTPAIEQYLPDLIITVSNKPEENPWLEARALYENAANRALYQKAYKAAMGLDLGFGNDAGQTTLMHGNFDRTRVVNVIGSPAGFYRFPYLSHQAETHFGAPYYISEADAIMDRSEAAELVYMASHPQLLVNHNISLPKLRPGEIWGQEIPRLMRVTQPYNFRASVVAAMHAADIVTNKHPLHVTKGTRNSCGKNCVVANSIFDPNRKNVIWQEVYPNNRNIKPGDAQDYGIDDDKKGNGNYIFV